MKTYVLSFYLFFILILEGANCKANDFNLGVDGTYFFRRNNIIIYNNHFAYGGGVLYNIKEKTRISLFCLFFHEDSGLSESTPWEPGPNGILDILYTRFQAWYFSPTLMCSHRFFQQKKFSLYAGLGFNSEYYYKTSVYSKTNTYEHEYIDKEIQMRSRNLAISCEGNYQLSKGISFSILPFFEKNLTNFEVDHTRYGVTLRLLVSPF